MLASFDRRFCAVNRWSVVLMLAAMAAMVFANVALRFFTDRSILWVEEASRYTMIWLTFIGSGLVLRYGGHIGIDALQQRLPRHAVAIRAVIAVVMLGFFGTMTVVGLRYAALTWGQTTPVLQIPIGAVYLAMPAGFVLMIVHLLLMARPWLRSGEFLAGGEFDGDATRL